MTVVLDIVMVLAARNVAGSDDDDDRDGVSTNSKSNGMSVGESCRETSSPPSRASRDQGVDAERVIGSVP